MVLASDVVIERLEETSVLQIHRMPMVPSRITIGKSPYRSQVRRDINIMNVGDRVRIKSVPPHLKDDEQLHTRSLFQK